MVISQKELPPEIQADRALVRKLLGLRPDLQEYKIVFGAVSGKDDEIAMQTRSAFQILNLLGSNVEVPPEHVAERTHLSDDSRVGRHDSVDAAFNQDSCGKVTAGRYLRGGQV